MTNPATAQSPATLTVETALEIIAAKSAKWARTFDAVSGTVECLKSDWIRRSNGEIIGASHGGGGKRTVAQRRSVIEVAAEIVRKRENEARQRAAYDADMQRIAAQMRDSIAAERASLCELEACVNTLSGAARVAIEVEIDRLRKSLAEREATAAELAGA